MRETQPTIAPRGRVTSSRTIGPCGTASAAGRADPGRRSSFVDEHDDVAEVPALGRGRPAAAPARRSRLRLGPPPPTDRLRGWVVTLDAHADRRRRAVRRAGPPDRRRHPGLRREALRPAGLADAAQRRRRGQPRLRADRPPAAGQAAHRASASGCSATTAGAGGRPRRWPARSTVLLVIRVGPPADPLDAARRPSPGVLLICDGLSHVQSRMGMLDAFARAVRPRRLRHADLRPRRRPRAHGRRARRGPGRRLPVRPPAGRALVAVRAPACCSGSAAR